MKPELSGKMAAERRSGLTELVSLFVAVVVFAAALSGQYLYTGNKGSGNLSVYGIGPNGALTAAGPPLTVASRPGVTDPRGEFMYIGETGGIAQYRIGAAGALTFVSLLLVPAGQTAFEPRAIDTTGRFLYATSMIPPTFQAPYPGRLTLYAFNVRPNGSLASQPVSEVVISNEMPPRGLGFVRVAAVHPDGARLFISHVVQRVFPTEFISVYTIAPDGVLTLTNPLAASSDDPASSMVIHPGGRFLYRGELERFTPFGKISVFRIESAGSLTRLDPFLSTQIGSRVHPEALTIDRSGRFLYALSHEQPSVPADRIVVLSIGSDGILTRVGEVMTGAGAAAMELDHLTGSLYVINRLRNDIATYQTTETGMLTFVGSTPNTGAEPVSLAIVSSAAIRGDVNGDGAVDCLDVALVRAAFGKRTGQPGWDQQADVATDDVIDIRDLAYVAQRLASDTRCQ